MRYSPVYSYPIKGGGVDGRTSLQMTLAELQKQNVSHCTVLREDTSELRSHSQESKQVRIIMIIVVLFIMWPY